MNIHPWRALASVALLLWGAAAQAQEASPDAAEFERIEATRAREGARYDAQEAACARRFAVSGCVKEVQSERRAMLANLRRQEATLHERQLAEKGAEQRRLSAQRAQERQQQDADLQADHTAQRAADKLQAQKDKQAEHAAKSSLAEPAVAAAPAAASSAATAPSAAEQAAKREAYARKQADAANKRQQIAQRLADKGKTAAPLPRPQ